MKATKEANRDKKRKIKNAENIFDKNKFNNE